MSRALILTAGFAFAATLAPPSTLQAQANKSCDAQGHCCAMWFAECSMGGGLLSETHQGLLQSIESARALDAKLCAYFGPESSECSNVCANPRCAMTTDGHVPKGREYSALGEALEDLEREQKHAQHAAKGFALMASRAYEWLRAGASNPLADMATVLFSYGQLMADLRIRIRVLRERFVPRVEDGIIKTLSSTGEFGKPGNSLAMMSMATLISKRQSLTWAPELHFLPGTVTTVARASQSGHIIVGGKVPALGERLENGGPVAFVSNDGDLTYSRPIMPFRVFRSDPVARTIETRVVEIEAGPPDDKEIIKLSYPDADQDGVMDSVDRCPEHQGQVPDGCPICPPGSVWNGSLCICQQPTPVWDGSKCVPSASQATPPPPTPPSTSNDSDCLRDPETGKKCCRPCSVPRFKASVADCVRGAEAFGTSRTYCFERACHDSGGCFEDNTCHYSRGCY